MMSSDLLIFVAVFIVSTDAAVRKVDKDNEYVDVCSSKNGILSISPKSKHIATVKEGSLSTVFVQYSPVFYFECRIEEADDDHWPSIEFSQNVHNTTRLLHTFATRSRTQRTLNSSWLTHKNAINYENITVGCTKQPRDVSREEDDNVSDEDDDFDVCRVKIIVIKLSTSNCSVNGSLSCRASVIWDELAQTRDLRFLSIPKDNKTLAPSIRYSIFTYENQSWVFCNETDKSGIRATGGNKLDMDTESIVCPVPRGSFKGPVLIRIEESEKTGLSVGLPVYGGSNTSYTYFSVFINQTVYDDNEVDLRSPIINYREAAFIAPVVVSTIVFVFLLFVALYCFKRYYKKPPKENKKSKFYVENTFIDDQKCYDNMSTHTQSTSTNCYSKNIETSSIPMLSFNNSSFFLFEETDDYSQYLPDADGEDEESVTLRRNIVARQLSGDPSKINPALSLNQQANVLAYNPKLEIERSNFSIGALLGSGNFGSVYVGEAEGLFYPGSKTKVAIKTVNDALDRSQLTALLCEVKILANLDHHLNLVNLMGACTSELHNGDLWLLLEYCSQGDLKNFLIRNRAQFQNNLNGLCATGLDSRLFLKWAHSIAKGMEYLTSRRIMHGDLAARNILISDSEGYIAKVSDFGLSKTFYDNVRYKKRFRHYVPWKWMAIEYLKDACFTMKSDVWSYGVVLWEIFSLGQEPYAGKSIEDVIMQIKTGYRLPCPEEVDEVPWADDVYKTVMTRCWDTDPSTRCSFTEIVNSLEKLLDSDEIEEYQLWSNKCKNLKELMLDDTSRSRRASLLSPNSDPADYQNMDSSTNPYVTVQQARTATETSSFVPSAGGYISVNEAKEQMTSNIGSYVTLSQVMTNTELNT